MSYETAVLIVNDQLQVLAHRNGQGLALPRVSIDGGRAGIALSRAVREQSQMEVFFLIGSPSSEGALQPLRLQSGRAALPNGFSWVDPVPPLGDFELASKAVFGIDVTAKSFGGFAWYTEVETWLGGQLAKLGHTVRTIEQWNGRIGGVLLRITTDGPQFWFKAVSHFNAREFGVAQLLAAKRPGLFPSVVATKAAWRALLLEHVEGTELYACDEIEPWKQVAELLADLQMDWVGSCEDLLLAGAADLRAETLIAEVPSFLDHIEDAMGRQEKTPPNPLTRLELQEIGDAIGWLCGEVASLPFSSGLANADFSPHNTLITSDGPVFIDWAEACVSLPLIAGEYLWNRMVVESPERRPWQDELRAAYFARWTGGYGATSVRRASELLPAFSVLAAAMFYHQRESHGPSPYDAYLRSLARKLRGELSKLPIYSCAVQN